MTKQVNESGCTRAFNERILVHASPTGMSFGSAYLVSTLRKKLLIASS